ncbi:MAG: family 20 glycosylhydrolase [Pyrinomonadaceae bacterium]
MLKSIYAVRFAILILATFLTANVAAAQNPLSIIPKPHAVTHGKGEFTLSKTVGVDAPPDKRSREIAAFLRDAVKRQTGITLSNTKRSGPRIGFRFDKRIKGDEAYRLVIAPAGIRISAAGTKGFFWAVQTLRQMLPVEKSSTVKLPSLKIEDMPEFSYRGHMLDVGRHFFPVEFIKKQIDLLSYYKINVFRWHLTEDQGWRIEIKKYPNLTKTGAWRTEADGTRYGGFYTQAEIKEVVEYARLRNITVIPEIEMPGHSMAALASYPELSCTRKPIEVTNAWGVHKDVFCAGDENTFAFLQVVLDEVFELFPGPFVHIGGDEVPKDRWKECPRCQLRIKNERLKDEHELQSYFIKRIQRYVESKGKTLIGWDEILEGGGNKNAIIEVWRGEAEGRKALKNGNRIITAWPFYFDTATKNKNLKDVYETDLLADAEHAVHRNLVMGAECPLWTEHITTHSAESMLYPRLQAFAETVWTRDVRDFEGFKGRLKNHYRLMDAWNVAYGPEDRNVVDYRITFDTRRNVWRLSAERGLSDVAIHYASDGREPASESPVFMDQLEIKEPGEIKVAPFRFGRQYDTSRQFKLTANEALGKAIKYRNPINKQYDRAGEMALVDGILGSDDYNDGIWAGWQGADLDAAIDLGQAVPLNSIAINFMQQSMSWIVLPKSVTFFASSDRTNWRKLQTSDLKPDAFDPKPTIQKVEFVSAQPVHARFVRVEAVGFGKLPTGHNGAGDDSWLFADEITVTICETLGLNAYFSVRC